MDITLALVRLHDKEVGHVSANMVLVAGRVAAEDLLQSVAINQSAFDKSHACMQARLALTLENCEAPGRSSVS